jgi:putative Ca2+/H+ antiporter (TMEM165/GDT1 family)
MYFNSFALPASFFTWFPPITTSYALIIAAEIGDKSQLVCMTLAARYRATPVIIGAITAFSLLNTLAVIFGVAIANWVPAYLVAAIVGVLFAVFGILALFFTEGEDEDEALSEKSSHSLFLTTFILMTVAEFGDKTQLAVVALSSTAMPEAIWVGSTLALITTSVLGVLAGRTLLQKIPISLLHRLSGILFIILAGFAAVEAYQSFYLSFDSFTQFLATVQ